METSVDGCNDMSHHYMRQTRAVWTLEGRAEHSVPSQRFTEQITPRFIPSPVLGEGEGEGRGEVKCLSPLPS